MAYNRRDSSCAIYGRITPGATRRPPSHARPTAPRPGSRRTVTSPSISCRTTRKKRIFSAAHQTGASESAGSLALAIGLSICRRSQLWILDVLWESIRSNILTRANRLGFLQPVGTLAPTRNGDSGLERSASSARPTRVTALLLAWKARLQGHSVLADRVCAGAELLTTIQLQPFFPYARLAP